MLPRSPRPAPSTSTSANSSPASGWSRRGRRGRFSSSSAPSRRRPIEDPSPSSLRDLTSSRNCRSRPMPQTGAGYQAGVLGAVVVCTRSRLHPLSSWSPMRRIRRPTGRAALRPMPRLEIRSGGSGAPGRSADLLVPLIDLPDNDKMVWVGENLLGRELRLRPIFQLGSQGDRSRQQRAAERRAVVPLHDPHLLPPRSWPLAVARGGGLARGLWSLERATS